jgi:hypothetical protein
MSFDAGKTDSTGVAFDDGLPEDLAALAQQLSDDAGRLTESYPADAQRQPRPLGRHNFWRSAIVLRWSALAASLLLMIGGGIWMAQQSGENPPVASQPDDEPSAPAKPKVLDAVDVPVAPLLAFDRSQPGDAGDHLTTDDVLKMTGPKLEAYGDIRAEESETMESISF